MLRRTTLAFASLLVSGSQAYAPIQMVSGQGKGLVMLPKGFPSNTRGALTPQKLSVKNPDPNDSPRSIPYFTARLDQTITWDDADWCLEATGNQLGDAVRVNSCSGTQSQKWNWIPDGSGHNMIQLKDTELCLDAIDIDVGSNVAAVGLWGCGSGVAQWQFEEPLPFPGTSQSDDHSYEARHVMMVLLTLAGVGAISLGAKAWRVRARTPDSMHPSRVAHPRASRTSSIAMAAGSPSLHAAAASQGRAPGAAMLDPGTESRIKEMVDGNAIMLFMKGTRVFPQCGFSKTAVQILNSLNVEYETCDVLSDQSVREGIKEFSKWPTIPQCYIEGEFIGGCDIMVEMFQSGELQEMAEKAAAEM